MVCRTVVSASLRRAGLRSASCAAIVLGFCNVFSISTEAANVTLAWDASSGPNVASYTLRYGTTSGTYPTTLNVGNTLTGTASNLVVGTRYYFVVTARNTSGLDSLPSNEVAYTVPGTSNNRPPTLNSLSNLTVNEDAGPQTVSLSGISAGATNEFQTLTVTAVSSNPSLIPAPTVNYTSPSATGSLVFAPVSDASGSATITVTVNDGQTVSNTVTRLFTVTVNPVNDAPTLNPIGNLSLNTNAGLRTIALSGISSGANNESQTLTVTATHNNSALLSALTVSYTSPASNGVLTLLPLLDAVGSGVVTVTVNDGGTGNNLISRTFTVTVNPLTLQTTYREAESGTVTSPMVSVSDSTAAGGKYVYSPTTDQGTVTFPLSITQAGDYVVWCRVLSADGGTDSFYVAMDTGAEDIYDTAKNILGLDVYSSTWQWTPLNGRNAGVPRLFNLTSGAHTLKFRARELGTRLDALYVTNDRTFDPANPTPTNAPPNVSAGPDKTVTWPASVSLTGSVTDDGLPSPPAAWTASWSRISGPGTVQFTAPGSPSSSASFSVAGQYVLRLTASDGALSASDDVLVVAQTAPATSPTLNPLSNMTLAEDAPAQSVSLSGITAGGTNTTPTLTITAVSTNPSLIPNPTVNYTSPNATGSLAFTPVPNNSGAATITVTVDNGQPPSNSVTRSFTVTVTPVNDPPTLGPLSNIALNPNSGPQTMTLISITSGATNEAQNLVVTATHNNPALLTNLNVSYTSPGTNGLVSFTPRPNALGTAVVTVAVNDGGNINNTTSRTFTVSIAPLTSQTIYREAEAGTLVAPMVAVSDASAAGGRYVQSPTSEQGTVTWQVDITQAGDYVAWCLVWPAHGGVDSFYVAVDNGPEDIYDSALNRFGDNVYTNAWRWNPLNGRLAGLPRVVSLSQGTHSLRFRGREGGSRLDAIYLTNDRTFDPNAPTNQVNSAPNVSAGPDSTITLPASANLTGAVTDDGLPRPPGAWTASWSKVSGPGTVQFSAPNASVSAASFSISGQYVLRLTASDGALSSSDDVVITVQPALDLTGPVVLGLHMASSDARTVVLAWNTDEPALCLVEYGSTTAFGSSTPLETVRSLNHTATLPRLEPSTTYYLRVRATDAAGNIGFSNMGSAGTPALTVFGWAAEDGVAAMPVQVETRDDALDALYLVSHTNDAGSITFPVQVPVACDYRLWCRVWAPFDGLGSFYVSLDGAGEDLFDVAEVGWKDAWQWVAVNGRSGGAPLTLNPRMFSLSAAQHQFDFRVHEGNTLLDQLILSNDPDWVPGVIGQPPVLSATAVPTNRIDLSWSDALSNEDGFVIEWSGNGATFSALAVIPAGTTNYQHFGAGGTTNYYRVYGFNDSDRTEYSNVATATLGRAPAAPTSLNATAVSRVRVRLTWLDASSDETGFVVERSSDAVNFATISTTVADVSSIDDTPPSPGRYYYRVRSFNAWGTSAPSDVDTARVR